MGRSGSETDRGACPGLLYTAIAGASCASVYSAFDGALTAWAGYQVPPSLLGLALLLNLAIGVAVALIALLATRTAWPLVNGFARLVGRPTTLSAAWSLMLVASGAAVIFFSEPFLRRAIAGRWKDLDGPTQLIVVASGCVLLLLTSAITVRTRCFGLRSREALHRILPAIGVASGFATLYGYAAAEWLPPISHPVNLATAGLLAALALVAWRLLDKRYLRIEQTREGSGSQLEPPPVSTLESLPLSTLSRSLAGAIIAISLALLAAWMRDIDQSAVHREPGGSSPSPRAGPDIVLIVLASARPDHMSVYGYERPTTPSLERLAEHATVFEQAWSSSPIALAAYATLFTGLYSFQHQADRTRKGMVSDHAHGGNLSLSRPLHPDFDTLAELLVAQGYRTAGFMANSGFLDPSFELHQGFEVWDARPRMFLQRIPASLPVLRRIAPIYVSYLLDPFRSAGTLNEQALAWLDRPDQRPAFLCVGYIEPHDPYIPRPPFDEIFGPLDPAWQDPWIDVLRGIRPLAGTERQELVRRYDAEIASVDASLGTLIDALRDRRRFDNALFVVTADHGEDLGEHGLLHHGLDAYETSLRIPFIVRRPGQRTGTRRPGPAHLVDVLPIALEAAGIPIPDGLPGVGSEEAALPRTRLEPRPDASDEGFLARYRAPVHERVLFAERSWSHRDVMNFGRRYDVKRSCMRTGQWKYCKDSRDRRRLFDLENDPLELEDLAERAPDRVAELETLFEVTKRRLMSSPAIPPAMRKPDAAPLEVDASVDPTKRHHE